MAIWFDKDLSLEKLKPLGNGTMAEALGIEWTEMGENFIEAKMPVDHRTKQPYGFLHGGASCALAETVGSVCSAMVIDHNKFYCVGLEINANHIRTARDGFVRCRAIPLHIGATTHVWELKIHDEAGKLICASRLTIAVIPRKA